jgi:hypothetical protein
MANTPGLDYSNWQYILNCRKRGFKRIDVWELRSILKGNKALFESIGKLLLLL